MEINKRILFFLILLLYSSCTIKEQTEVIWLVPKDYKGAIGVYYDYDEEGTDIEYEGNKRVYRIPEDGILKTKFSSNVWIENSKVFYLDEFGNRSEIPFMYRRHFFNQDERKESSDIVAVGIHGRGSSGIYDYERGVECTSHKSIELYIDIESNMEQYNTPVYDIKNTPRDCKPIKER